MIIVGYQGIGKSTLAGKKTIAGNKNGFIDLESGNFWVDGKRDPNWAIVYANIAVHLSRQGYHIFTSSHEVVRSELRNYVSDDVPVIACYPALELKDVWCDKLKRRFQFTGLEKDYKAWKNAEDRYEDNINELMKEYAFMHLVIKDLNYDLEKSLFKTLWEV